MKRHGDVLCFFIYFAVDFVCSGIPFNPESIVLFFQHSCHQQG